jgi:hypothetical protein
MHHTAGHKGTARLEKQATWLLGGSHAVITQI